MRRRHLQCLIGLILILLANQSLLSQDYWQSMQGPHSGNVLTMFSPSDDGQELLVGTRSGHHGIWSSLHYSDDRGSSWSRVLGPEYFCSYRMNIVRLVSGDLFLSCTWINEIGRGGTVHYRSKNNGQDWDEVNSTEQEIIDMVVLGDLVIASSENGLLELQADYSWTLVALDSVYVRDLEIGRNGEVLAASREGLFSLENNGGSWTASSLNENPGSFVQMTSSGELWFATYEGLLFKDNLESAWVEKLTDIQILSMEVSPSGKYVFVADLSSLHVFENGHGYQIERPFYTYKLFSIDDNNLLLGSSRGVEQMDIKSQATQSIGIPNTTVTDIAIDANDQVYVGTSTSGLWLYTEDRAWVLTGLFDVGEILISSDDVLYVTHHSSVSKSNDGGSNWQKMEFDDPISGIYESPSGRLFVTPFWGDHLYYSDDGGQTFVDHDISFSDREFFNGMAFSKDQKFFIATNNDVFELSHNQNWRSLNPTFESILGIDIKTNGDLLVYGYEGLFTFSQSSKEWNKINAYSVESFYYDGKNIFLGTLQSGLWWSNNDGDTWQPLSGGLPGLYDSDSLILSIAKNSTGTVFAGTRNSGLFESRTPIFVTDLDRDSSSSPFNYPNPFSKMTNIVFTLDEGEETMLRVFDMSGKEVATLSMGLVQAGTSQVEFDATSLPSSVYIYELSSESRAKRGVMHLAR